MSGTERQGHHASSVDRDVTIKILRIRKVVFRGFIAEFLSAFVFMFLVESTRASAVFTGRKDDMLLGAVSNGIAVALAMYVSGGVSGAFLNPAVTLAWASLGKLRWSFCFCYSVAQYLGAFVASGAIYIVYYDALQNFDGGVRNALGDNGTAGIYATYPADHHSLRSSIVNEIVATAMLLIAVLSVSDRRNWRPDNGNMPLVNGMIIVALCLAFHGNGGAAMNPARDFSPRVFSYLAGWSSETFSLRNYQWFWIPAVLPYAGALIGATIYELFIEIHWPPKRSRNDGLLKMPSEAASDHDVTEVDAVMTPPILAFDYGSGNGQAKL